MQLGSYILRPLLANFAIPCVPLPVATDENSFCRSSLIWTCRWRISAPKSISWPSKKPSLVITFCLGQHYYWKNRTIQCWQRWLMMALRSIYTNQYLHCDNLNEFFTIVLQVNETVFCLPMYHQVPIICLRCEILFYAYVPVRSVSYFIHLREILLKCVGLWRCVFCSASQFLVEFACCFRFKFSKFSLAKSAAILDIFIFTLFLYVSFPHFLGSYENVLLYNFPINYFGKYSQNDTCIL